MSVDPTDWQCCLPVDGGLMCTKPLVNGGHDGECAHEHDYALFRPGETYCGCDPPSSVRDSAIGKKNAAT